MQFYQNWHEEMQSAYLYKIVAQNETLQNRKDLFNRLSEEAEHQAGLWANEAKKAGQAIQAQYQPNMRTRIIALLIRYVGATRMKPALAAIKIRGLSVYSSRSVGHPIHTSVDEVGASHRSSSSGGLRAAVFGVNDGLVSIACLLFGVAGAASSNSVILLTGIAGLLAGAFSMAAGEYISMRSQREMFEYQIALEREELAEYPEEEAGELALIYMARGMPEKEALALGKKMIADPEVGLDTLAREELGLNPDELGSPWTAAISSFFAFVGGGIIPILPYLLEFSQWQLESAIGFTAFALFSIGAALSLFTGRSALWGGLRMLLIGGGAGLLTYWIGHLMGASLA
jgi:VIT1/CCC1 family predicted Fe2+/Mn2+ transporter